MEQHQTRDQQRRFGKRVREARTTRDMTQADVAEAMARRGVPVHKTAIAKIEAGTRATTVTELVALAGSIGVTPDQLLTNKSDAEHPVRRKMDDDLFALSDALDGMLKAAIAYTRQQISAMESVAQYQTIVEAITGADPDEKREIEHLLRQFDELRETYPRDVSAALKRTLRPAGSNVAEVVRLLIPNRLPLDLLEKEDGDEMSTIHEAPGRGLGHGRGHIVARHVEGDDGVDQEAP